jgi:hypothetical protein
MISSIFLLAVLQQQAVRQAPVPPVPAVLNVLPVPSPAVLDVNISPPPVTVSAWHLAHQWHLAHLAHLAALKAKADAARAAELAAQQAAEHPVVTAAVAPAPSSAPVSTAGDSSFQACVIRVESGGNPQAWNPSGLYWGLYQFSAGTWAAYGGNPADYGHAGAAEQNQVFASAIAAGGASNWAPYDGCTP